jgi:hypothetical protein
MTIYIYKKTHNTTGLKYLGKTVSKDPYAYKGSGVYWSRHIKKYGYDVTTEILKECQTETELVEWGLYYSKLWNVVESKEWANLREEAGPRGSWSKESKEKLSKTKKEELSKLSQQELADRMKNSCTSSKSWTAERKEKISKANTGKERSIESRKKQIQTKKETLKILSTEMKKEIYGKTNVGKTWKLIDGKRVWLDKEIQNY